MLAQTDQRSQLWPHLSGLHGRAGWDY